MGALYGPIKLTSAVRSTPGESRITRSGPSPLLVVLPWYCFCRCQSHNCRCFVDYRPICAKEYLNSVLFIFLTMTQNMYTQPRAFANQFLWSQALARFGSLHQAKRARLNTSMPKLEPMFVPHMPPTILPRAIAPMINTFMGTFPGGKANLFTNAMTTRKNAVCRNFGSVRCSKCNKFGLSGECCKAYYYVVIRSKSSQRNTKADSPDCV